MVLKKKCLYILVGQCLIDVAEKMEEPLDPLRLCSHCNAPVLRRRIIRLKLYDRDYAGISMFDYVPWDCACLSEYGVETITKAVNMEVCFRIQNAEWGTMDEMVAFLEAHAAIIHHPNMIKTAERSKHRWYKKTLPYKETCRISNILQARQDYINGNIKGD